MNSFHRLLTLPLTLYHSNVYYFIHSTVSIYGDILEYFRHEKEFILPISLMTIEKRVQGILSLH